MRKLLIVPMMLLSLTCSGCATWDKGYIAIYELINGEPKDEPKEQVATEDKRLDK